MPSSEFDLQYLEASLGLLEDYLLSQELYWQLGANPPRGEPAFPSLTLGAVLLAQARANARRLAAGHEKRFTRINQQIDQIHKKWPVAWEKKARQEYSARLKLWRNFLEEYRQSPKENANRYAYEVGRRVMLALLEKHASEIPHEEEAMISGLDGLLNAALDQGDFIWENEVAGGFSKNQYPYLYGKLKE